MAREMGYGPLARENRAYVETLHAMGVLASEMEAAHLFVLSDVYSREVKPIVEGEAPDTIKSGAVLAIIGDESAFASPEVVCQTEDRAIEVALNGAVELIYPGSISG
jgi:uridine phosphorylase